MAKEIIVEFIGKDGIKSNLVFYNSREILQHLHPDGVPLGSVTFRLIDYGNPDVPTLTIYDSKDELKVEIETGNIADGIEPPQFGGLLD